jgi:hypothetical protein
LAGHQQPAPARTQAGQHLQREAGPARLRPVGAAAQQAAQQEDGVAEAPRPIDRPAPAAQPGHEGQVHQLRGHQHADGDAHRRAHVLLRIEARRQHLDGDDAQQPDTVAPQRRGRLRHVVRRERAVVEQHRDQRRRKDQQRHRAGQASSSTRRSPQSSRPE